MVWFRALKRAQIQPKWKYSTEGIIWRLLPAPPGHLIGEERDTERKTASFFCLEKETGKVRWSGRTFGEQWWVGIAGVQEGIVFLHEYATPDMPDHKKVYAVEVESGNLRWKNDELRFLFAKGSVLYAGLDGFEEREIFGVDVATGKVLNKVDADQLTALRAGAGLQIENIEFPIPVDPAAEHGSPHLKALERLVPDIRRIERVECIEKNGLYAVCAYEDIGTDSLKRNLRQHFVLIGKDRTSVLYDAVLADHVSMAVPDTFFGWDDFVYSIMEKRTLLAIHMAPVDRS